MFKGYQETQGRLMLCPSILSADFTELGAAVDLVRESADMIHLDVMDGHFVPNLTLGPPVIAAIRKRTDLLLEAHLMVTNPLDLLDQYIEAGADIITVHAESCPHLHKAVQEIHKAGRSAGVALNPGTPLSVLEEIIPYVDMILLMTVNPGFGGQKFIPTMMDKITRLRTILDQRAPDVHIAVDGGIGPGNINEVYKAGANIMVVGSACYGADVPCDILRDMRVACDI